LLEKYGMNQRVNAYLDCIPFNFEDRLQEVVIGNTRLRYYVPSLEDLVVMKIYGLRENDEKDLSSESVLAALDWQRLESLVYDKDEAPASALSERRYREMVENFKRYQERYCNEGADL
jgi:hypothetical protein